MKKREFIKKMSLGTLGFGILSMTPSLITGCTPSAKSEEKEGNESAAIPLFFTISLAQWSLHKTLFSGKMDNLDFPERAKKDFGIEAVEYVNQFFKDKARDQQYLAELKKRADDNGVKNHLIMIDGEGNLGATDPEERKTAVENHYQWVEAAKFLGCNSIRVNAAGKGSADEVGKAATDGLAQLSTFAKDFDINVIVENHGGYSSDGQWLANVISSVGMKNCGTLPDFGNFCIEKEDPADWNSACINEYDRYKGIKELMPYAKGVSAKSHDFNEKGEEIHTDFSRMLKIVKDAGFSGYIGIEYEGSELSEAEGIKATKALLEKTGRAIS